MLNHSKKISLFFLAVLILTALFFSDSAQASFWDMIKAWVTINPLFVEVSAPSEVEVNKIFQVKAEVKNKGGEKIEEVEAKIFLPEELETKKDEEQEIGVLSPYKEKTIFWPVKGVKVSNYYVILVSVSGELKGQLVSAEDSTMVKVIEKILPGREREHRFDFFQRFLDFLREWFGF